MDPMKTISQLVVMSCAMLLAACSDPAAPVETEASGAAAIVDETDPLRAQQVRLLDEYFAIYKAKDVEAMLARFDDDIIGVLYPTTLFGRGIEAARGGIEGDFNARQTAWADMPHRFRIARDKWVTFGESVNGEERAPLMIVFDLDDSGEKIEATYTQIAFAGFIDGASVNEPTQGMRENFAEWVHAQSAESFGAATRFFADDAALYAYPPGDLDNHGPVITGASDVASVLAFKWGEGLDWQGAMDATLTGSFVSQYMQYVFVAIPGAGLDRAALFTFGADPAAPDYEKIVRVDVMGPSGG